MNLASEIPKSAAFTGLTQTIARKINVYCNWPYVVCILYEESQCNWHKQQYSITQYSCFVACSHSRDIIVEMLDDDADFDVPVDIFAIGFEEIVDLNAGNIVSARSVYRFFIQ